jgi:hypothetical protein
VRAFKPTFDELTSVSRDLRNTLDEELGINDIRNEFRVGCAGIRVMLHGRRHRDFICTLHIVV